MNRQFTAIGLSARRRLAAGHACLVMALTAAALVLALTAAVSAEWWAFHFEPGQAFEYRLLWLQHGESLEGDLEIRVQESSDGYIYIIMLGGFAGHEFAFSAEAYPADLDDLFFQTAINLMTEAPEGIGELIFGSIWLPWFDFPLYGAALHDDWEFREDDGYGTEFTVRVTGEATHAGLRAWIVGIEADGELPGRLELAINPDVPLPIRVAVWDMEEWRGMQSFFSDDWADAALTVELVRYQTEAEPLSEIPAGSAMWQQARPTGALAALIEHFRETGFEIGMIFPNYPEELGAAKGYYVEIGEYDMEIFWFDRANAAPQTLARLEQAAETGRFVYGTDDFEIEMVGVVQDDIFLTGLDFEPFFVHPQKEEIEEAFAAFQYELSP